ncbi:MAG: hypothetical protein KGJ06_04775 [Pseudomonadota bacterium]|nr:hypothetical protein [Pseudomonadota bacterium]
MLLNPSQKRKLGAFLDLKHDSATVEWFEKVGPDVMVPSPQAEIAVDGEKHLINCFILMFKDADKKQIEQYRKELEDLGLRIGKYRKYTKTLAVIGPAGAILEAIDKPFVRRAMVDFDGLIRRATEENVDNDPPPPNWRDNIKDIRSVLGDEGLGL